jgi:hypothetical protein
VSAAGRAARWAGLFAAGFVFTGAALGAIVAMSEHDTVELGSPDFGRYCRGLHGETAQAVLTTDSVYGWSCMHLETGQLVIEPVDPGAACRQQYGDEATAEVVSVGTRGWRCYGPD